MARPSLKTERRNQIFDACEICLTRYGVEGTTLDRVAEEAGLARPLIRHNVGNRDDLLAATVERFIERSDEGLAELLEALPEKEPVRTLVDWLFDPSGSDAHFIRVSEALSAAAANNPDMARVMRHWTERFVEQIAGVVRDAYPDAEDGEAEAVAAGIAAIQLTAESVTTLGPMTTLRQHCRAAAMRLVDSLEA